VGEIRTWLKEAQVEVGVDVVDVMLLKDVTLTDIPRMSSLTMAQIDDLAPSHLRQVLDAARVINSDFFALRAGILTTVTATLSGSSSAQSAV
jgi:hypothetical protein